MAEVATNIPEPKKPDTKSAKDVKEDSIKYTEPQNPMLTKRIIVITVVIAVGSIQYGYYLWVEKHPAALLREFPNNTHFSKATSHVHENLLSILNSIHIIIFSLGGIIGCVLLSPLVDKCGRKGALLINNYLSVLASAFLGYSPLIDAYEYTFFAHLLTGMCTGIFSCVVPLYIGEIAPQKWRGSLISVSTLAVTIGLILSDVLGRPTMLGNEKEWPILLGFNGFLAVFQIIIVPTFPESPRYLLIQRKNERKAEEALQTLRGQDNVTREIQQLYQEETTDKLERNKNLLKLLSCRGTRWQMLSVLVLVCGQQLTGLKAVMYYTDQMATKHWLSDSETVIFVVLAFLCIILPLVAEIFIIERVGRKILLLMGFGVSGILCILLITTLELQVSISQMAYISSAFLLIFLVAHMLGPGPITNVMLIELFLQSSRSTGIAIGGVLYWLLNVFAGTVFVPMERNFGSFAFFLFLPMCLVAFFYTAKIIPETTDKSFLDIKKCILVTVNNRQVPPQERRHSRRRSSRSRRRSSAQSARRKRRRSSIPS